MRVKRIEARHPGSVLVSAHTGAGVDDLLVAIGERLRTLTNVVELVVPYDRGEVVAALHRYGEVLSEDHGDAATRLRVRLDASDLTRFDEFRPPA